MSLTYEDIPYVCAVVGGFLAISMMVLLAILWPHWHGWGAVIFVAWPMGIAFLVTVGFIAAGIVHIVFYTKT